MNEIAYGGFTDTVREFALIAVSWGEKIPCLTGKSKPILVLRLADAT